MLGTMDVMGKEIEAVNDQSIKDEILRTPEGSCAIQQGRAELLLNSIIKYAGTQGCRCARKLEARRHRGD